MKKILTLCIPIKDGKVLLGMKKRGMGIGMWNGFGGKVEEGETIEQAIYRELEEESGIKTGTISKYGVIDFSFRDDPKELEVHIYKIQDFTCTPFESDEMRPEWFLIEEIPFENMWPDDIHWLPLLLEDKMFRGRFVMDKPSDENYTSQILEHELEELLEI